MTQNIEPADSLEHFENNELTSLEEIGREEIINNPDGYISNWIVGFYTLFCLAHTYINDPIEKLRYNVDSLSITDFHRDLLAAYPEIFTHTGNFYPGLQAGFLCFLPLFGREVFHRIQENTNNRFIENVTKFAQEACKIFPFLVLAFFTYINIDVESSLLPLTSMGNADLLDVPAGMLGMLVSITVYEKVRETGEKLHLLTYRNRNTDQDEESAYEKED